MQFLERYVLLADRMQQLDDELALLEQGVKQFAQDVDDLTFETDALETYLEEDDYAW